jgi:hypothetical protein
MQCTVQGDTLKVTVRRDWLDLPATSFGLDVPVNGKICYPGNKVTQWDQEPEYADFPSRIGCGSAAAFALNEKAWHTKETKRIADYMIALEAIEKRNRALDIEGWEIDCENMRNSYNQDCKPTLCSLSLL